jgi:hypothetical protein
MKSRKQHRYVSHCGPFEPPHPLDIATMRALAVAENEGWPAARPVSARMLASRHLACAAWGSAASHP